MICEKIELKKHFSFLGENGNNPTLDIYLPYNMVEMNRQNQKRPCLLVLPGGGYGMCSERESEPIAIHFLPEGFNVFVLTYSVAPNRFPTQIIEVAAAMEVIYENADKWNCDVNRIAVMGFSAGGHLAAHYSTMYDCKEVRGVFKDSKRPDASVLCYPVITSDFTTTHQGSFINLTGHNNLTPEEAEILSCEKHVSATTPPAFIWHTAEDNVVPVENSIIYAKALAKYKIPFELHIFPFGGHGLSTCDKHTCDEVTNIITYNSAWLDDLKKWFNIIF
ncbi:MAG: alpha/beta hydrolase [Ruminococcaceae bacterium]|nr:alpha/beta hydrolase [Oscillospiraceae bacterium]